MDQIANIPNVNATNTPASQCLARVSFKLLAALLSLAIICAAPLVRSQAVGTTPGELSVANGIATYNIPIVAAPGIAGMIPELSLQVSSPGMNGIAGLGGSLAGLSVISRCPKTIAQDGFTGGINLNHQDGYCLDGQRLILTRGSYGKAGSEYRTEIESFSEITAQGNRGDEPQYFRVRTKSGQTIYYGNTDDSRLKLNFGSNTISWSVNRIEDAAGNAITIQYENNSFTGEQYPLEINYAGNQVHFEYETRPDQFSGYRLGNAVNTTVRLSKVMVDAQSRRVREYRLDYAETDNSQPSRLASVELCSAQGDCLEPVNFSWEEQRGFSYQHITTASRQFGAGHWKKDDPRLFGDFNGDGNVDIAGFDLRGVNLALGDGDGTFIQHNTSPYFKGVTGGREARELRRKGINWNAVGREKTPVHPRLLGDVNGDGKTDIIGIEANYGRARNYIKFIHLGLSDGDKIQQPKKINTNIHKRDFFVPSKDAISMADIDGDSLADIVLFNRYGTYVAYSQGNSFAGFAKVTSMFSGNWDKDYHPRYAIDLNGDSRADLIGFGDEGVYVSLSSSNGFIDKGRVTTAFSGKYSYQYRDNQPRTLSDINGDGLPDIVGFSKAGVQVAYGLGNGTFKVLYSQSNFGYNQGWRRDKHIRTLADINGDGRSDLVGFKDDGVYIALAKPLSHSEFTIGGLNYKIMDPVFSDPQKSLNAFGYNTSAGKWRVDNNPRLLLDIDGNGSADILGFAQSDIKVAKNSFDGLPPRLIAVTDGFGVETQIDYSPMTNSRVYQPSTLKSSYPTLSIKGSPKLLVSAVHTEDGQGGKLTTSYRYGDMQVNLRGRGSLGFAWTETEQQASGVISRVEYHQQWPLTGMPKGAQQTLNGKRISSTVNSYGTRDQWSGKVRFPYVKQRADTTWELNGRAISTVTTNHSNLDAHGNIQTVKVTTEGGGQKFIQTTQSQYANNTGLWHLGRLTQATVTHQAYGQTATRISRFQYNGEGLLTKEIIQPGHAKALTTSYSYDSAGNRTAVTLTGQGISARTSKTFYDGNRQFPIRSSNALGHSESRTYDPRFGVVTQLTGPNRLSTQWHYDDFGRKIREQRADGNNTYWQRQWARDCKSAHPRAVWCLEIRKEGAGLSNTQFDKLGRQVRSVTTSFDGRHALIDKQYDRQGREFKVSQPYFQGEQVHWTESFYDELNRVIKVTTAGPEGYPINVKTAYNGLENTVTNAKGQSKTTITNVVGKVVKVLEPLGASVEYTYDALGNLLSTKDAKGLVTRLEYDQRGHKTKMIDPAMGTWHYKYNAAGELIWQKDSKQQVVNLTYDALGRLVERKEPEGTSRWNYDSGSKGIGKLAEVTSPGYKRAQTYDQLGRPSTTTTYIDGKSLSLNNQYDNYSRVKTVNYPMGFEVIRDYNQHGYLTAVKSPQSLIQDYQRRHIDGLFDEVLDRIKQAQKKADQYTADAARYRAKAKQYQNAVDSFKRQASDNLSQAAQLESAADRHAAVATRERRAQAADQRIADRYQNTANIYQRVANYFGDAADRNQASAASDLKQARALDSQAATLERSIASKRSAGYREYRAARIDAKLAKRLRSAAKRLNKIATRLESRAKRYQAYAKKRLSRLKYISRTKCSANVKSGTGAQSTASRSYCTRIARYIRSVYVATSSRARIYIAHAEKWRQRAASVQAKANRKSQEARKHWQQGTKLLKESSAAKHQAATKRRQADRLESQAADKKRSANWQDRVETYLDRVATAHNNTANNYQARANRHAAKAQQAESKAKTLNASVNQKITAANALDKKARDYLALVNAELHKARVALANAERYAKEVQQLQATADSYQALQQDQDHAVFWRAQSRDAAGRLNSVVHGNGLTTQWSYNQATGTLERIRTGLSWDTIRELEYDYDNNSNVSRRSDITNGINESFNYDALDRLQDSTVYSSSNTSDSYNKTIDYNYDLNGNITYKSDVGSYSYNGAYLIHAGSKHRNYRYDPNGNLISGGGRNFAWSSFNKPTQINKDSTVVNFSYDADRKRYKRVDNLNGTTTTTLYLGKTYEQIKTGNHTTHKYFIYAGDQLAAIHFDKLDGKGDQSDYQTRYLHADALGSVDLITDGRGQIVDKLSYDPFGKRRPSNWRVPSQPAYATLAPILTNRGFTSHEHVDAVGIIHMNGRIYDAELGRFLSADPTMQFPYSTQGQNRYAYVQNNPLKYVDMNGYGFFSKLWKKLWNNKYFRMALTIGVAILTSGAMKGYLKGLGGMWTTTTAAGATVLSTAGYMAAGAVAGAAAGFVGSGGDLKAALTGALTGAAFGWVGSQSFGAFQKAGAHGLVGGAGARMNGGSFKDGFAGAFFAAALNPHAKGNDAGALIKRSLIGGASAKLGGGKFANGAVSAAMAYVLNDRLHASKGKVAQEKKKGSLWNAVKEGGSAKVGPGAGYHIKEAKLGPLKAGGGFVFGSGGVGVDSEGLSVWGKSTADVQLSVGRFGGRAYLWDIDIGSSGVNNIGTFGASAPTWDWSIGIGGTITPYSFEVQYNFEPLYNYLTGD